MRFEPPGKCWQVPAQRGARAQPCCCSPPLAQRIFGSRFPGCQREGFGLDPSPGPGGCHRASAQLQPRPFPGAAFWGGTKPRVGDRLLRPLSWREAPVRAAPFLSGMEGPCKTPQQLPAWTLCAPRRRASSPPVPAPSPQGFKSLSCPVLCSGSFVQMKGEASGSRVVHRSPFPAPVQADLDAPVTPRALRFPTAPRLRLPHGSGCPIHGLALAASSPRARNCRGK